MKSFSVTALVLAFCAVSFAQGSDAVLATANGQRFTAADLPAEVRKAFIDLPKTVAQSRSELLEAAVGESLAEAEASARGVSLDKLIDDEIVKKVSDPTEADARSLYDANRQALGGATFEAIKPRILAYLRQRATFNERKRFIEVLKAKYKPEMGKGINTPGLKADDVLFTLQGKPFTSAKFEERFRTELFETEAEVYEGVRRILESLVFDALVLAEAKARNISSSDLFAQEITDKLKDFTDEEREGREAALRDTLFSKYKAQLSLKMPTPPKYDVATSDDPSTGPATASVTIVMFSDFQCSACAAAHPVIKNAMRKHGSNVRLVVRDFPLESIHANAFGAAVAANAASRQGKFFEYIDLLYSNQDRLELESLKIYAQRIGLNMSRFEVDLDDPKIAEEVRKDQADGLAIRLTGTPTIFINGVRLREFSGERLNSAIETALGEAGSKPRSGKK